MTPDLPSNPLPPVAALTPLACYASYEISAIKNDGPDCVTACDDDDPGVIAFGLYGRDNEGLARWISDHPTKSDAEAAMRIVKHNVELSDRHE